MHHRRGRVAVRIGTVGLLVSAVALFGMPAAYGTITAPGATSLATALTASGTSTTGASWHHIPSGAPEGVEPNGISDAPIDGFPTEGSTFAILTTGDVFHADQVAGPANYGADLGDGTITSPPETSNSAFDVSILKIDFNVGAQMNCIRFDFRFFTEEYLEYVGADYNDAFIAELDSTTWSAIGTNVNPGGNFAFDGVGNPITVNTATMGSASGSGTIYDGATAILTAAHEVSPGAHSLYLSIFDQGADPDTGARLYDSAVFLDNFVIGFTPDPDTQCMPGARPKVFDLDLTPPTTTKTVGSSHTVTATLNEVVPSELVPNGKILFSVSGVNSANGSAMTDQSGQAAFAYTGTHTGLDTIFACYDANQNDTCGEGEVGVSVTANWISAGGGLPITGRATGLIAGGGALALILGVIGYVLVRRRRVRFVAE